jgi:hypothetical protein
MGLAIAGMLVATGLVDRRTTPRVKPEATADFIAAFQRSLGATFALDANYTRVLPDGKRLESATFVAQRGADHLQRQFGGITGTIGGHQILCSTTADGQFPCGPAVAAADPKESLSQQLENLRSYFAPPPLYRVIRADDECFELTQVRRYPTAPYGTWARMCFDPETGAVRFLAQHLEGATDTFSAVRIRSMVTDQDFSLSQDRAYDSTLSGLPDDTADSPGDTSETSVPVGG